MKKTFSLIPMACAALLATAPLLASDPNQHHGHHGHHGHTMPASSQEATTTGTLHQIDPEAGTVNLTHPAIPELGWPEMTMDLPVTNRVDLTSFSPGDEVKFTLRLGRDQQYRLVEMEVKGLRVKD